MPKRRGQRHTTLTETARTVVKIVESCAGVKMVAPGEISSSRANSRRITISHTTSGLQLTISGQGVQRVAVHTDSAETTTTVAATIRTAKELRGFIIAERSTKPGI